MQEQWVNVNRNDGSTCAGIYRLSIFVPFVISVPAALAAATAAKYVALKLGCTAAGGSVFSRFPAWS